MPSDRRRDVRAMKPSAPRVRKAPMYRWPTVPEGASSTAAQKKQPDPRDEMDDEVRSTFNLELTKCAKTKCNYGKRALSPKSTWKYQANRKTSLGRARVK